MPRPRTSKNKPYGRQAKGKTIKSLSLDDAVVEQVQREADKRGISFSELVNGITRAPMSRKSLPMGAPRLPAACPSCGAALHGDPIPERLRSMGYYGTETHYSRVICVTDPRANRFIEYGCPDCGHRWAACHTPPVTPRPDQSAQPAGS